MTAEKKKHWKKEGKHTETYYSNCLLLKNTINGTTFTKEPQRYKQPIIISLNINWILRILSKVFERKNTREKGNMDTKSL